METHNQDRQPVQAGGHSLKYAGGFAVVCLICTLLLLYQTGRYDRALRGIEGGPGIVALELAFSPDNAWDIILQWEDVADYQRATEAKVPIVAGIECALQLQKWEWLLILSYTCLLSSALLVLIRLTGLEWDPAVRLFVWVPVAAAVLNILENIWLTDVLVARGDVSELLVIGMSLAALGKFLLLGVLLISMAYAFGFWCMSWWTRAGDAASDPGILKQFAEVRADERKYLYFRRKKAKVEEHQPYVGLASSGGGIRSATVNLGVIERLLDVDLFRRVDYHSTVSGGGYIGSALGSLLSFKKKDGPPAAGDDGQYLFTGDDAAHFDCARPDRRPFPLDCPGFPDDEPVWLSRRMVLGHIRACGDYLVRRNRLLSRDVLRAAGTIVQGMTGTFCMFLLGTMFVAAICFTLLTLVDQGQGPVNLGLFLSGTFGDFLDYALQGWPGALSLGMLFTFLLLIKSIKLHGVLPDRLFQRDGDTLEDCRQFRTLWLMGILLGFAAFAIPGIFIVQVGVLAPAVFLAGAVAVASGAYLLQCMTSDALRFWDLPDLSDRAGRSFFTAAFGLSLGMTAIAVLVGFLPWLVVALLNPDPGLTPEMQPLYATGSTGFIAMVVAGLIAQWKKATAALDGDDKEAMDLLKKGRKLTGYLKRLLLALPIFILGCILLVVCAAFVAWWAVQLALGNPGFIFYAAVAAILGSILALVGYVFDFNKLSLHHFYRDRLAEAYMSTSGPVGQGSDNLEIKRDNIEMRLSDLHGCCQTFDAQHKSPPARAIAQGVYGPSAESKKFAAILNALPNVSWVTPELLIALPLPQVFKDFFDLKMKTKPEYLTAAATSAPYQLYCACLNLTSDRNMHRRTRKSDTFLFSKLYCGSTTTGFLPTRSYRGDETKVARAMTISGAAVDSSLGRGTFFAQSFAMTLFNIRLGQWLENPGYRHGRFAYRQEGGIFWPAYLIMEACGMSDARHRLVHLSDGGHTGDNLGIVPLFERGCGLIVAVDAEADPGYGFGSLLTALRYLENDDNIRVRLDLDNISPDSKTGLCRAPFALGAIEYLDAEKRVAASGCLLVLKAAVTAEMSLQLRKHKARYPDFPQETTADQFFSEDQFEVYRLLGKEIADLVFSALPSLTQEKIDCESLQLEYAAWLEKTGARTAG